MSPKQFLACILGAAALSAAAAPEPPRVLIAPVQVAFDKNWLPDMNSSRGRTDRVNAQDVGRIAADMAASLQAALAEAVRARGFEVVSAPAPGVVRLSATIQDLYVNAPEGHSPGLSKTFVREAGRATLRAEGRDAASGAVRLQTERSATAGDTGRLERATDVSNSFWFDAMFRNWAREVANELHSQPAH